MSNLAVAYETALTKLIETPKGLKKSPVKAKKTELQVSVPPMLVVNNTNNANAKNEADTRPFTMNPIGFILSQVDAMESHADQIHEALCFVLAGLAPLSGAAIAHDEKLKTLFSATFKGDTRARIAKWFGEFSPIRVKFNDNGSFKKVTYSSNTRDAALRDNKPVFDLEGAKLRPWYETSKARTKPANAPDYDTVRKSLQWMVARIAHAKGISHADVCAELGSWFAFGTDAVTGKAGKSAIEKLADEYASGDKFESWKVDFDLQAELKG